MAHLTEAVAPWPRPASTTRGPDSGRLEALTDIIADDMVATLGWPQAWPGRRLAARLCRPAARHIAARMLLCDQVVAGHGLHAGAVWTLQRLVAGVAVTGREYLPVSGPLLIAANHPGLCDTLALI